MQPRSRRARHHWANPGLDKRITLVTEVSLTSEPRPVSPVSPLQHQPALRRASSLLSGDTLFSQPTTTTFAMAARGARSRKVVEKVINKEDNKRQTDRFSSLASPVPDALRVTSPVAGWRRKTSVTTSGASVHSGESNSSTSTGAKIAKQLAATMSPSPEDKFVAKNKTTAAPRGRGGGVPTKISEAKNDRARVRSVRAGRNTMHSSQEFRPLSRSTTSSDLSPHARSWENTRMWSGGVGPPKHYRGFEHVRIHLKRQLLERKC
jgi:hypothetical protein